MTAAPQPSNVPAVAPGRVEVCLVSMPYASLNRPSLALGLLKALLEREGIATRVLYPSFWFAEEIGLFLYHLCAAHFPKELLAGEWTFAAAAFGAARPGDALYLQRVAAAHLQVAGYNKGPEGAERLAADLRRVQGMATDFIESAAQRVLTCGARIVGCTSSFEQHVASLALLRRIREIDPSVVTLLGGANCEGAMGRATHRSFPWVDYVVSGEADGLLAGLCRDLLAAGREVPAERLPTGVFGPPHRNGAGPPRQPTPGGPTEAPRAVFRDLDSLPTPDFDDYFLALGRSAVAAAIRTGLPLETSRGCWWGAVRHCTFCGLNGTSMSFRSKSPRRVLEEMRELELRHGIARFETVDNILDMSYFKSLVPQLAESGGERRIFYEVKSNLKRWQVEMLRRAGILWIQPGIESLHTAVLELMEKGVQGWQNLQLLKWCRELGIRLTWNLLWGFPGEDDGWYGEMAAWLPALEHLQPPGGVTRVRYDRFSPYQRRAEQFGLALRPIPAMAHVYPLAAPELEDLTYFFAAEGRPDVFADGAGDLMEGRPGATAMRAGISRWRRAFWRGEPPVLAVEDDGTAVHFTDSRSCAVERRFELSGLERAIYLACEEAPRGERLASLLAERHGTSAGPLDPPEVAAFDEVEVAAAAERLVQRLVLLPIDRRLVSLGVHGPLPPLAGFEEFPGGFVAEGRWQWA